MTSCRSRTGYCGPTRVCSEGAGKPWESLEPETERDTTRCTSKAGFQRCMHAECADLGRPCLSLSLSFPHSWQSLPDTQRLHLAGSPCCWPCLGSRLPPPPPPLPPTILLGSSCGNSEWGRRFGGALGAAFPLRDSPRGASGRRMFPRQPGDSAWQPPASLQRDRGRPAPAPNAPKQGR